MPEIALPTAVRPYVMVQPNRESVLSELDAFTVLDLYRRYGAILFRGFASDLDAFRTFTESYCATSVFNESPDRKLLDAHHNIQSVNGGEDAFPLHPELSREPWKPDVCFFCCFQAPARDGQTTICDGVEIVKRLPADLRAAMAGRRLLYVQPASSETLTFWLGTASPHARHLSNPPSTCPYRFVQANSGIMRVFSRPLLHTPMFSEAPAFGNFLLFARDYLARPNFPVLDDGKLVPDHWVQAVRDICEDITVEISWQNGDLIMLDNSRFMHGRRAIVDAGQRMIASVFGYLKNAPRVAEEPNDPPWRRSIFRPPTAAPGISI